MIVSQLFHDGFKHRRGIKAAVVAKCVLVQIALQSSVVFFRYNMRILDCETPESILNSLSSVVGADRNRIQDLLLQFDIDKYFRSHPQSDLYSEDLLLSVIAPSAKSLTYDATCWFHLTRAGSDTNFEQGILPLGIQIDSIWDSLFDLLEGSFPNDKWSDFRHSVETDSSHHLAKIYRLKTTRQHLWGPYAILIQDMAFDAKAHGNHDYLGIPEIIDDICTCFQQYSGINIRDVYVQRTRSCIIKFINSVTSLDYLKSAIKYLYLLNHKTSLVAAETYSFDGRGQPVPPDQILKIHFP
jgi:hypothetical protein